MINTFSDNNLSVSSHDNYFHSLTKREWDVLLLLTEDLSNQEIADGLHLTRNTVKTYRRRIAEKLLISGKDQLARFSRKNQAWLKNKYFQFYPL
ncbi:response regulator transcription factor [Dyadobacter diqingensis]|uniref:response regulator transcription factor n=1 Tax=Dyadobacter diqingensis TaxID=2938121 RepID=UPI0035B66851